mmetsp:Transcript_37562/g.63097  ORF Transcript_37562/g.63097 Transcript_37562/m.63097 type:complete len:85 (+) Transcript_37562:39-293(+)
MITGVYTPVFEVIQSLTLLGCLDAELQTLDTETLRLVLERLNSQPHLAMCPLTFARKRILACVLACSFTFKSVNSHEDFEHNDA